MRARQLFQRTKGKDGEGRQSVIKHILLPAEVVEDLQRYKTAYSIRLSRRTDKSGHPIPVRVTWEQLFRRWMDHVGRFDPDVKALAEELEVLQEEKPPALPRPVDPTVGNIWDMKYTFERDGEELEAHLGDKAPFYAVIGKNRIGYKKMLANGWMLINEVGIEIDDIETAKEINRIIKAHRKR